MIFGNRSVAKGYGIVSTPLIMDNYYYLILEGISVGNKKLNFTSSSKDNHNPMNIYDERIIIDSGTVITSLPYKLYNELVSAVKSEIKFGKIVPDPIKVFKLCYSSLNDEDIPIITVHFKGADLKLKPLHTFTNTSPFVRCLAFHFTIFTPPIFGNMAQTNLWVAYDLEKKVVSFKPTDCTKL